jgi:hypothetical protein
MSNSTGTVKASDDVTGLIAFPHDNGPGGHNFLRSELWRDMLAFPAQIYRMDALHGKFGVMLAKQ